MEPALGTQERSDFLYKKGQDLLAQFSNQQTPADSAKGVPNVNLPNQEPVVPDLSQVKGRVDFNKSVFDYYKAQADKAEAQKADLQDSKLSTLADESLERFENLPNIADIRSKAQSLTGFDDEATKQYFATTQAATKELATLSASYDNLLAQRDQAIEARRQQGGGTTAGTEQAIAQISRDFAFRLNQQSAIIKTKAAVLEAQQGNFTEAQSFIKQAVDDATYETKFNLDMFSTFYGRYENQLEKLDSKYNDAIKTALSQAKEAYDAEYQDKLLVGKLMIDPDYRGSGVTLNDTPEQAFAKISSGLASGVISTTSTTKQPTATQFTAANYGSRIVQANNIFDPIEEEIAGMNPIRYFTESKVPSALQSASMRQYKQASRNFINAVLRRESGAAIADSEFENAQEQYLVKPGDDAQTIAQKRANRALVQQNFLNEAGAAYIPSSLTEVPTPAQPETVVGNDGKKYVRGADGLYYEQ